MSIKLNFFRRLMVNAIYFLAILVMFIIPAIFAISIVYSNIELVAGSRISLNWAIAGVFFLIIFGVIYLKYFRKWFHRKLIGLQVRDELGIMPVKGIVGIVIDRLLRTIEFVYPFFITLLMLYVGKYAFSQFDVFENFFELNVKFLYFALAGFGVFLVGDFVKVAFMKQQEIDNKLKLEARSNRQELKRLKKDNKKAIRAAEIERELRELKESMTSIDTTQETSSE